MGSFVTMESCKRYVLLVILFSLIRNILTSVTHYSIPEEMKEGSVVANLATDLGLDVKTLNQRKMRIDIIGNKKYLDVNKETGELYIVEKIDREHICPTKSSASCYLRLEVILENPLRIFNIEVEILDMNDNAPQFRRDAIHLDISEATPKGERFSLSNAVDPDVGSNSVKTYHLSESDHFNIEVQTGREGSKFAELILSKPLDREQQAVHSLILTAVDGGTPARSGTASVIVHVLDTNDNAPVFDKVSYNIKIIENSPIGSLVIHLNATDLDEGSNSDITYSYSLYTSEKTQETFNLNPSTGEITVKGMLNYEDFKVYDMEVVATDKGANSLSGQCTIKILVEDMNDNHPEISIKSFQSPVNENIELDTVIAVVSVSDKDSGDNGVVDLHIPDNMPFKLRESSDNYYELVVSEPLDREKVPEYDITFTVTDRGSPPLSDNETMTLELLDVNDNVPQFPRSFYTIRVMENNAPGALLSSLTAFDPDLHENQYLVYFILEKEIANTSMSMLFSINPENGNLYALKTFDYEIEKEFLFHIEARDSGSPPLSSNVTVHIIIVDQNDNAPVIVSPWRAHGSVVEEKIPRSTDKGSLVAKVIALDTDSVHNSRITYQFLQVTDATLFSLDQYNGEIRTMRMFSYRDPRHQRLVVVAKDNGEPALSATVTIKLSTVETAVKAYSDMSEVPLEYDIFSDLNLYLVIGLGSVSFLLLITILVTIVLKCQKPKPSKAAPPCRNSVISERNSTIADSTLVSNDAYWYSLFLAETRKGKLVVRQPVPKGSRYIVSSIPRGTGLTDTSDSAASTLQLLDVNDNVPQFPRSFYTIRVMENNAPGALLSSLTAFDPDLHENQYLVYFILEKEIANTSMSMLFSINPENGNLYALKTFDYEIEKEFLFHIEARDSGSPPLSSNVTVHIIIVDQNDNAPVIVSPWRAHGSVVEEKIPRSTDKGSLVAKVIALDTDSVHNSRITYQFLQVTDATLFSLDQYNGEIRTMRMFSYRDPRHQRLVVVAKDNGEPALSATVTIKLSTVETAVKAYSDMTEVPLEYDIFSDLNLYLVIGLGSVSFLLLITILVTIVLKCQKPKPSKAAPPCRNSVISERNSTIADSTLVSNDAYWYSLFLAETRKGKLVVRQPVPKGSRYIVSSIPRGTGLTDTSDSAASTLQSWKRYVALVLFSFVHHVTASVTHYSIPEEMKEGSVVANLATDLSLDVKTLNQRKMRLDIVANKKYLDVNKETGELYIVEKIDREYICTTKSSTSCYLKLEVILENPVRIFNIEVEILDMNDNAPQFRRDVIHLDISEATPKGDRFSLSNAVDPDVGSNSVKTYHLSESEHFNIEVQTGRDGSKFAELILTKALDREQQAVHNLILTAVDGGTPARSGTASVIVRVLDTNDNAPAFDKVNYNLKVMENSPIGSLVIHLNATDLDEGSNSDITYSYSLYTSEKTQETFNLNPSTGEITVKGTLNYEDFKIYDMEVIATDKGANSLSGQCTIKILVEDMNDNHPEISIKSFQSPVNENIELDTVIAVVSVSDKDSGDNGVVDLHIPDNMPFKLRESSDNYYELVVSEPLDREKVPEYDITFTVTDRGSPPLSDNETMTLELLDVNDNVPQFPQAFYTIRVMENNAPGALLSSLTAFDPDLHENQYLVYFILEKEIANTSMSMLFSINPENGNLYALKTFDYEIEKEFLFHIEARDSGSPPLSSNVSVHIIIVDQNDNAPVIVSPWRAHGSVVEEKIPRSTDKGSLVAKVIALDTDSVHNSRITYQFLQVTDATLFSLDQYNGEIRTMRMFSYRDPRHQRLVVVAKDNGEPALSATVTIKLSTVETAVKAYSDMTEVPLEYDIFSDLNLYLVIGLGSVSFLLLITILVTIVLKCQKPKPSKAAPPCRNSVISERNSTIADSTLVSNDAYWYSLFLAETRKGKLVVRQPVPKGSRYIVSSIPRGTGLTDTSDSAASTLQLLDVNDNVPQFPRSFYTIRVMENNAPGALLSSLTAFDPDLHENQYLVYFILEKEIANTSMSMLFSINPENGNLYALKTFDYEIEKEFLFHIEARDSGSPPLSSNVTVHIIIVDQNDNAPVIVSPWRAHGSVVEEKIPRSTDKGSLVAKVIALDTDSVHNSRITYQFLQVTDATLFSLDQYNGEIRTMRMFSYRDPRHQRLVVVAKDNGEPALSATVTIKLSTVETAVKAYSDMTEVPLEYDIFSDLNLYLVIGLGSVSFLLLITILVTIVLKCQKPKPSKAAPPCRNSVISERNSTIADSTLVSNDAYWYSLFLAETRKGKLVVRQPVPKGSRYIVSSIPRGTGLTDTSDSAASTLQGITS
ncbi:uncharacterized protein ABDE67_004320 [Symphorus nematophorus]